MSELRVQVEREAAAGRPRCRRLTDGPVSAALVRAAALVRERSAESAGERLGLRGRTGGLDEGTLDRLRLDESARSTGSRRRSRRWRRCRRWSGRSRRGPRQRAARQRAPDPDRRCGRELRGATERRPRRRGQLLKSLNTAVLRTGGAALRTVTVLVDDVLRPALEAGAARRAPSASFARRIGGRAVLVSLPHRDPARHPRGSGETTAALARLAAEQGVRTLAHAEGGGVLYVHAAADRAKALALAEGSLDRLGVCNRLNLLLVDRGPAGSCRTCSPCSSEGLEVRGPRAVEAAGVPLDVRSGTSGRATRNVWRP